MMAQSNLRVHAAAVLDWCLYMVKVEVRIKASQCLYGTHSAFDGDYVREVRWLVYSDKGFVSI